MITAYADDVAIIAKDPGKLVPVLQALFDLAKYTGLEPNGNKS